MGIFLFAVVVLAGVGLYFMTPEERKRLALLALARVRALIEEIRTGRGALDPLHELLLARQKWPIVAPLLALVCVAVWFGTLFSSAPPLETAIAWGASYAPRTTNGEWSRLVTYTFVHAGLFHTLATVGALVSLGVILERLVGSLTFAAVYLAAAIVSGVVALWTSPATTTAVGASGAIFGLYGLLVAAAVHGYVRPPRLPVSPLALKRLGAGAALFLLYNLITDDLTTVTELAGLATGLMAGTVLMRGVATGRPPLASAALVPATVALIAILAALPFRGTIDARPEIARIAEMETATSMEYARAVNEFTQGRLSAKALVKVIQGTILPTLQADRKRIEALHGVPSEQVPLVTAARHYFDLRETSWQRRVEGLLRSNSQTLRDAALMERSALDTLDELRRTTSSVTAVQAIIQQGPQLGSSS